MNKSILMTIGLLFYFFNVFSQNNTQHDQHSDTFIHFEEMFDYYEELNESKQKESNHYYYGNTFDYLLRVKSLGIVRKIRSSKLTELKHMFKLYHEDIDVDQMFEYEVLVEDKGFQFWIPIQEELIASWKETIAKRQDVLVNITLYGTYDTGHSLDWIYTMHKFNLNIYPTLNKIATTSFHEGRFKNALNVLNELIAISPNNAKNYSFKGEVLLELYENQEKHHYLSKALLAVNKCNELNGNLSDDNFYVMALGAFHKEEYSNALEYTNKASSLVSVENEELKAKLEDLEKQIQNQGQ